jgi:pyridoxine 5-phosphate synthase
MENPMNQCWMTMLSEHPSTGYWVQGPVVSLFLDPNHETIRLAKELGADIVEIHTGKYANATGIHQQEELEEIIESAKLISKLGMQCHAGHGLTYKNVAKLAKIDEIELFNIGHFLIGEAIYYGLEKSVNKMYDLINA